MISALFLKHAESTWNAQGRWQGLHEAPLSERGERDAHVATQWLRRIPWTRIVSSGLIRARRTAEIIGAELDLPTAETDAAFNEYDHGEWVGLTRQEIEARWPGAPQAWREGKLQQVPGGERREDFVNRIRAGLVRLQAQGSSPVLVIAHGGVIEAITTLACAEQMHMGNLTGRWFEIAGESGVTAHDFVDVLSLASA